jgi:hypothetical protein
MAKSEQPGRKPTHSVYFVKGTGKDANWVRVGAAWIHDDGEGLNLALDRFVVRANKADTQSQGEAAR